MGQDRNYFDSVCIVSCLMLMAVACMEGLKRTDLSEWRLRSFDDHRFEVMIPANTDITNLSHAVLLQVHPDYPEIGSLADGHYLITVNIKRTTGRALSEELEELSRYVPSGPGGDFDRWFATRHDSIARIDNGPFTHYRYDVACPEDDLLTINVEQINPPDESLKQLDDAAIRRILESVRCF